MTEELRQHGSVNHRLWRSIAPLLTALLIGGCVSDGPPLPPPPRPPPPQPVDAQAERLVLGAGQFAEDTDRNGFYDTVTVAIYLFDSRGDSPIDVPGSMSFRLATIQGEPIAAWTFDEAATAAARERRLPGVGYFFRLSLLDNGGSDRLTTRDSQLFATFTQKDGRRIDSRVGATIVIGPTR